MQGRYIHLPPVDEQPEATEALAITATRLANFAMKMATGYTPDTGDPRRLAIYREIFAELQDAQAHRSGAGVPIILLAGHIVAEVARYLTVDYWRLEAHHTEAAIEAVVKTLRVNPAPYTTAEEELIANKIVEIADSSARSSEGLRADVIAILQKNPPPAD